MRRLYPSRLVTPSTNQQSEEMQMLYNTRNRSERIHYGQKKRLEGDTITDIALLLHSSTTTINRYLAIPEDEIPESRENVMERKHMGRWKKRTHQQSIGKQSAEPVKYIPRKFMGQLIYRKIEEIKGLTQEQYGSALKKYPVFADLYAVLKEFHRIVFYF